MDAEGALVVFVCTCNTCRSPMAEALFNAAAEAAKSSCRAISAGLYAIDGEEPSYGSIVAMSECGLDITRHESRRFTGEMAKAAALIVGMSQEHVAELNARYPEARGKTRLITSFIREEADSVANPHGGGVSVYRSTRDVIALAIPAVLDELSGGKKPAEKPKQENTGRIR